MHTSYSHDSIRCVDFIGCVCTNHFSVCVLFFEYKLHVQVKYKRTELLQHPVIGSYLHLKWNRIGFWYYFFTLVLYGIFLVSLSLFSLLVNRPRDNICKSYYQYNARIYSLCMLIFYI